MFCFDKGQFCFFMSDPLDQIIGPPRLFGSSDPMYNTTMSDLTQRRGLAARPREMDQSRIVQKPHRPRVHVVATGGTIAMRLDPGQAGAIPAVSGADLLAAVPEVAQIAQISVKEFSNIPSEHMTAEVWLRLAAQLKQVIQAGDAEGIVITHGTDTMEETAFFLDLTVRSDVPIVLTGAQRPASAPDADGPRNLRDAIQVAACPESRERGVMIVMHGEIHSACEAIKANTEDLDAFDSRSGTDLGYVRAGRVRFTGEVPPRRLTGSPGARCSRPGDRRRGGWQRKPGLVRWHRYGAAPGSGRGHRHPGAPWVGPSTLRLHRRGRQFETGRGHHGGKPHTAKGSRLIDAGAGRW